MAVSEQQHEVRQANLPPQDLDAEESVLGAMMVSPNAISIVAEVLGPEDFYRRSHGQIYETIRAMYAEGEAVDSITVINALQARGILEDVGGKAAINTLASTVPSVSNARRYAEIVRETSTYRGLIRAARRSPTSGTSGWATRVTRSTAPSRSCSRSPTSGSPATSARSRSC